MATNLSKYHEEVLKILDKFKRASVWSDFIEPLDSLRAVFKKYNAGYAPCIPQLIKRLNQLLNPALPGGVHIKTIECYNAMVDYISQENLIKDFDVLTIGLFSFSSSCKITVAGEYLDLLEKIVTQLGPRIETFSKHVMLGFLPFMESESSDFFNRAYDILVLFLGKVSEKMFYMALWKNFIDYPDLRASILNFLGRHKVVAIPDYNLVAKGFCLGLEGSNPFIIRPILEISNRDFPYTIEAPREVPQAAASQQPPSTVGDEARPESSVTSLPDSSTLQNEEHNVQQVIRNLISNSTESINDGKEECNANIIRGVLKIFLKKEVGMHKRAYKWLNISETIQDRDVDYIEKGLRTYLNGSEEDLSNFFRIVNALADKENLTVYLMERLILDAIQIMMKIDEKKNVESFYYVKKNVRTFLNHSLDEFYRVIYMKLNMIFEKSEKITKEEDEPSEFDIESSSSDYLVSSTILDNENKLTSAEELIHLVFYSYNVLDAVDSNVSHIHIPLLCHLVIKNKEKITYTLFTKFLDMFLDKCEYSLNLESRVLSTSVINAFYQKESPTELLEISLVAALAKELGRMDIYKESTEESIYWADSNLAIQDGILVWSEAKNIHRIPKKKGNFFNFYSKDVQVLQNFIKKHGFKDFPEEFLQNLGKYLAFNYKFVDLINIVSFYIDYSLLRVNLWNDFILSKNAKYLMHFEEDFLLPFILEILPTLNLKDICLFLQEALLAEKYYEVLFRVATIVDQRSSEFVELLLNLNDCLPLAKNVLNRYYQVVEATDPYEHDTAIAILFLLQNLIENENFLRALQKNSIINLEKFGNLGIKEALVAMLTHAMIKNEETRRINHDNLKHSRSVVFDYKNPESGMESSAVDSLEHQVVSYSKGEVGIENSLRLLNISSTINNYKKVYRFIFNILYIMNRKSIEINIEDIKNIKTIVKECKKDFYIMKRTIFLLGNDVEFIYNNYHHFYKPVFAQINEMPVKEAFFTFLISEDIKCSVDEMREAIPYVLQIKSIKKEAVFKKCFEIMAEECMKSSALYKKVKGFYRKIDQKILKENQMGIENHIENEDKTAGFANHFNFAPKLTESEISALVDQEEDKAVALPSLVLAKCGDLENVKALATHLFTKNPALFVGSMPNDYSILYLFGIFPFKADLYEKILSNIKSIRLPVEIFQILTKLLPVDTKMSIVRFKAEFIRNAFAMGEPCTKTMRMLLELFKYMPSSDLLKIIISNILHYITIKAEKLQKSSGENFEEELKILERIIKVPTFSAISIIQLKNCCFALLYSKEYQEKALVLIYMYLQANPNCKIFIDAFVGLFYKSFFEFGVSTKKKILETIATSPNFDSFAIMNNLISGMETSIFSTAQSEKLQRIINLKKISFLILSQPKNRFSSMSDMLVKIINDMLVCSSDITVESIKLSTALMLKIDNNYLQTLFPILVADFMTTVFTKDLAVVLEIFRFVDISIWLDSPVFAFRILFIENHTFYNQLKSQMLYDSSMELSIDYSGRKLPNFLTRAFGNKQLSWSELFLYLKSASKYYDFIEFHIVDRDFEKVEECLVLTYKEGQ